MKMKKFSHRFVLKSIGFVVLVVLFLIVGCKESDLSTGNMLQNQWQWVQTSGGIGGVVLTPTSEGYNQALDFTEDGTYIRYMNNAIAESGSYRIVKKESILDHQVYDTVIFEAGIPMSILTLTDHQLILREEVWDGFTDTYRR